jgi:hypothetical protein
LSSVLSRFIIGLAGFLLAATAAYGAPAERLGVIGGHVLADGKRYAAWRTPDGATRVLNTRTGKSYEVATPEHCRDVVAVGGGYLVWQCTAVVSSQGSASEDDSDARLLNLATRQIQVPTGIAEMLQTNREHDDASRSISVRWTGVGAHWIVGTRHEGASSASYTSRLALNWRTGEIREEQPDEARLAADPGLPGLARRLCSPLARRPGPERMGSFVTYPAFGEYQYERPFGLAEIPDPRGASRYALERCGTRRIRRLGEITTPQLGSGYLSFRRGTSVRALDPRSGRVARWRVPDTGHVSVAHTENRVLWDVSTVDRRTLYAAPFRAR